MNGKHVSNVDERLLIKNEFTLQKPVFTSIKTGDGRQITGLFSSKRHNWKT